MLIADCSQGQPTCLSSSRRIPPPPRRARPRGTSTRAKEAHMEIGIDSFAARFDDAGLAASPVNRMRELLERIEQADQVGLDVFGVGEHHKREFLDSAPPVILAAAAARTRRIRLTSAVAVLSAVDPVRLFQPFATLDLISEGPAHTSSAPRSRH